eukprot:9455379-Alexandrium_andersonii.AAC.1
MRRLLELGMDDALGGMCPVPGGPWDSTALSQLLEPPSEGLQLLHARPLLEEGWGGPHEVRAGWRGRADATADDPACSP